MGGGGKTMKPHSALGPGIWAGLSLSMALVAGGPAMAAATGPTFDQVLAAPDDEKLNLDYATAEANAGNLLDAAAALERILLAHPDWSQARLLYAVVLYRLDDLQGADRQLRQLGAAPLSPLQRAEVAKYRRLIAGHRSQGQVSGELAAGLTYEGDALGALFSQLDLTGPSPGAAGGSATVSGRLDGSLKLTPDGDLSAYGSISGYDKSSLWGPSDNFQFGEIQAGLSGSTLMGSWKAGGVVRHYRLLDQPYLTEYGGRIGASVRLNTATSIDLSSELVHQDFDEPEIDALQSILNGDRDGWRYDGSIGVTHRFSATASGSLAAGYEHKSAGYQPFAYSAPRVEAAYSALLGRGAYLNLFGQVRWVDYAAADPILLFGVKRKDTRSYGRVALGAPLSAFTPAGATGDVRENLILEWAATYTRRDASAPVADYSSFGTELRLIWRFGARGASTP